MHAYADAPAIQCIAWATDIDVLPAGAVVDRRDDHWVIRSPSNPHHWWGNFLLFDNPPEQGDGDRWEALLIAVLGPDARHRTFAWDVPDGNLGAAEPEFVARGYELEHTVALVATPDAITTHPRENRDVRVRPLDPRPGADAAAWGQTLELWVAHAREDGFEDEAAHREYGRRRLADLRELFSAGRGAWWVAELPGGEVAADLGIVVSGPRARYQSVGTAAAHRRLGICSRLVAEAARRTAERHRVERFVICADPGYHALGLYEGLGFRRVERVTGALRRPEGTSS